MPQGELRRAPEQGRLIAAKTERRDKNHFPSEKNLYYRMVRLALLLKVTVKRAALVHQESEVVVESAYF